MKLFISFKNKERHYYDNVERYAQGDTFLEIEYKNDTRESMALENIDHYYQVKEDIEIGDIVSFYSFYMSTNTFGEVVRILNIVESTNGEVYEAYTIKMINKEGEMSYEAKRNEIDKVYKLSN